QLIINVDPMMVRDLPKDRNLVVGIRAEHLFSGMEKDEHISYLEAVNVEQLGNETSIAFDVGDELWTAKWPGQWNIHYGQMIPVQIMPKYLLFFDGDTGKLLKSAELGKKQEVVAV